MDAILAPLQQTQRLRDIAEMTPVPWWPPAPGWWLILAALALIAYVIWRWRAPLSLRVPIPGLTLGTWRWEAAAALRELKRRVRSGQDAKTTAGELSELLRRIAMARLGRPACAGLTGQDWLDWLAAHDPNGFAWSERGRSLVIVPYAPPGGGAGELLALIEAAEGWVRAREPRTRAWRLWPARAPIPAEDRSHV